MRSRPVQFLPLSILFLLTVQVTDTLAGNKTSLEIEVAPGHDSNPLELPEKEEGGLYTAVRLEAGARGEWTPMWGYFVDADALTRLYESDVSSGDRTRAELRTGLTWTPYRKGPRAFAIAFGGTYGVDRSTYVDPATGEPYEMFDGSADIPVPDRFDFDRSGLFVDLRWRTHHRVLVYLDTAIEDRRFVEPYAGTVLEPLDDRTLSLEPGVLLDLTDRIRLDVSILRIDRAYDDLRALDENALPVNGTTREYESIRYNIAMAFTPWSDLELAFGLRSTDREDLHANYYDFQGVTAYVTLDYAFGEETRFEGSIARRTLDYDNATIDNTINGETRDSERLLTIGRVEHALAGHFSLFLEAGLDRTDNQDPLFTYDRHWAQAGVQFRL